MMRITVDIDDREIKALQQITGKAKKSPAIQAAIRDYLREAKKKRIIRLVREGKTDYGLTNDQLEAQSRYDPD